MPKRQMYFIPSQSHSGTVRVSSVKVVSWSDLGFGLCHWCFVLALRALAQNFAEQPANPVCVDRIVALCCPREQTYHKPNHNIMSPIKRIFEDTAKNNYLLSPKRLRGGGSSDADAMEAMLPPEAPNDEDELFDDALAPPEEEIPEEILAQAASEIPENDQERWKRPPVSPDFSSATHDLNFQWLDMDVVSGKPLTSNPNQSKKVVGSQNNQVPILRCYGVDEHGHSVTAFIHGYTPYAYFAVPEGSASDSASSLSDSDKKRVRMTLNERLKSMVRNAPDGDVVIGVEVLHDHRSLYGYQAPYTTFLKVYVALPNMVPPLKRLMEGGIHMPPITAEEEVFMPFECNVPFVLRFMVDRELAGAGWLSLLQSTYTVRSKKETHCQLEVDVSYDDVVARKSEGQWNKSAPLRILSFDIECQGRKGQFPEAEQDPVIQIANVVTVYGEDKPMVQNVFTLKGCLPIVGAQVISSETEADMLAKWSAFLRSADPDILTGYNVQNFDVPYLLDRAEALMKADKSTKSILSGFSQWGRIRSGRAKMKDTMFQSGKYEQ